MSHMLNRALFIVLSGVSFIGAYLSYLYLLHSTPYDVPTLGVTLATVLTAGGLIGVIYAMFPQNDSDPFACFWYYAESPVEKFTIPWGAILIAAIMATVTLVIGWAIVTQIQNVAMKSLDGCQNLNNLTQTCIALRKIISNGAT